MLAVTQPLREFRTLDDVVEGLSTLEHRFRQRNDRRAVFSSLYGVISVAARERVTQRFFEDNDWVQSDLLGLSDAEREQLAEAGVFK